MSTTQLPRQLTPWQGVNTAHSWMDYVPADVCLHARTTCMGVCCSAVHTELEKLAAFKVSRKWMRKTKRNRIRSWNTVAFYDILYVSAQKAEYKVI